MKNDDIITVLAANRLFAGITREEIKSILHSLGAHQIHREPNSYFLMQQNRTDDITIIVQGHAVGERYASDGVTSVINEFYQGDLFGDVLSGASTPSIVNVRAVTECLAIGFPYSRLLDADTETPQIRATVLRNLIGIISDKYFAIKTRLSILLSGSLQTKILLYLKQQSQNGCQDAFAVPHNRDEMAAYLGCERSALSRELSRMKKAAILDFRKNRFHILDRGKIEEIWL